MCFGRRSFDARFYLELKLIFNEELSNEFKNSRCIKGFIIYDGRLGVNQVRNSFHAKCNIINVTFLVSDVVLNIKLYIFI